MATELSSQRHSSWRVHVFLLAALAYWTSLSAVWLLGDGELENSSFAAIALLAASAAGPLGFLAFANLANQLPAEASRRSTSAGRDLCLGLAGGCIVMSVIRLRWILFYYFIPVTTPLIFASLIALHFSLRKFEANRFSLAWATGLLLVLDFACAIMLGKPLFLRLRTDVNQAASGLFIGQAAVCLLLAYRTHRALGDPNHV